MAERKTYEQLLEAHPSLEGVLSKKTWDFVGESDKATVDYLRRDWFDNFEKNVSSGRFKRNGGLHKDCIGIGKNKAIVGIGAGPSLNKNIDVLKKIHDLDGVKPPEYRDFIFIASNHMYKPLLNQGIIPDFVMVADASDVVMDQLTVDIPESGRNCILITGLHCSPRVLKKWEKQGREIRFYLTSSPGMEDKYKELIKRDPKEILIQQGGNVLNSMWSIALKFFQSTVFMALGNDLSYPLVEDLEERRKGYYADGDYSSNAKETGTGRDEAARKEIWPAFTLSRTNIVSMDATKRYNIELDLAASTGTLWVYKTWLETNVLANQDRLKYMYYNCSEGGIAGVMCKDDTEEGRAKIENWFLMDQVCKRWRTRMFEDAIYEFLTAKDMLRWGTPTGVPSAMGLAVH